MPIYRVIISAFPWYCWAAVILLVLTFLISLVWGFIELFWPTRFFRRMLCVVSINGILSGTVIGISVHNYDQYQYGIPTVTEKPPDLLWASRNIQPVIYYGCKLGCWSWKLVALSSINCRRYCRWHSLGLLRWVLWQLRMREKGKKSGYYSKTIL